MPGIGEPSRTAVIIEALRRQLMERRELLDRADDLAQVSLVVDLHAGTNTVKCVGYSDRRINRRAPRADHT